MQILKMYLFGLNRPEVREIQRIKNIDGTFMANVQGDTDVKKYARHQLWLNRILKERLILPTFYLFDKIFKKHKKDFVVPEPHNYLLIALEKSIQKGRRDWVKYYHFQGKANNKTPEEIDKLVADNPTMDLAQGFWEWGSTVLQSDQAWKEFVNMVLLNLRTELNNLSDDGKSRHLIYNSNKVDDIMYFSIFDKVQKGVGMHNRSENDTSVSSFDKGAQKPQGIKTQNKETDTNKS